MSSVLLVWLVPRTPQDMPEAFLYLTVWGLIAGGIVYISIKRGEAHRASVEAHAERH